MNNATLLEFINSPLYLAMVSRYPRKNMRESVRAFEKYIGKAAEVADVTEGSLESFRVWLGQTRSKTITQHFVSRVRCLVRLMAPGHLPAKKQIDHPKHSPKWPDRDAAAKHPGTLRALFESEAAASLLTKSYRPSEVRIALRRLAKFLGHEARPEEITDDIFTAFGGFVMGLGASATTASEAVTLVRAVVRLARPDMVSRKGRPVNRPVNELAMSKTPPPRMMPDEVRALTTPDMRLSDAFWHVYYPRMAALRSAETRKLYRLAIERLSAFLGRHATLADLNDDTIVRWIAWMADGDHGLPQTINCRRSKLVALWNFLARKRFVEVFPDVPKVDEPLPLPMAWTMEQFQRLLDACRQYKRPRFTLKKLSVDNPDWWVALHLVAYDAGGRAGELFSLRWDWLDVSTGDLNVPAHVRKGRKRSMLYKLQPDTVAALERIRVPGQELMFPLNSDIGTFYNRYREILNSAGLPSGRRDKLHRVRRTFASHLEAVSPGAATDALAHSSRAVTRAYIDERIALRQRPSDLLPRPWAAKGGND